MGSLKDLVEASPVHGRSLDFKSYPVGDDRLLVEGSLRDERLVPGYQWDGRPRESGVVHWMSVRVLVAGFPLTILDAEGEMFQVPHDLCHTTLESVKRVIGISIASGYSERIRQLVGGTEGCSHLTHLLLAMGPAALHGFWTQQSRKRRPLPRSIQEMPAIRAVLNSCKLWEEDGPLVQMVREAIAKPRENTP